MSNEYGLWAWYRKTPTERKQIVNETSEQRFARQLINWAHGVGKLLRGE